MFLSFRKRIFFTIAIFLCLAQAVLAVTSVVTRHRKSDDFLKGKTDQVSIDSEGVLRLASRQTHLALGDSLSGVWTINTAVVSQDGTWFIGTSPNGTIVKASGSNAVRIYPETSADSSSEPNSLIAPIRNEHVFALNFDAAGRLLAGISGQKGTLIRFSGSAEILFESEADKYIFAIVTDENGSIYFGTGPEGKIYRIAPFGGSAELVYDSRDKNILSLLFTREGELIAGSDTKGLVYKIDVENKTAVVLYDSAQAEITALAEDENGNLYAAASSVAAVAGQIDSVSTALSKSPGRPDTSVSGSRSSSAGKSLKTASTSEKDDKSEPSSQPQPPKPTGPKSDSQIYKITPQGFVTEIFSEKAVFYSLIFHDGKLFAETGNNGLL